MCKETEYLEIPWFLRKNPTEARKEQMEKHDLLDPKTDDRIRAALRNADAKGKLGVVAAVTGIAGGEAELRKIMESTGELPIIDRGMLGMHLGT
jgi:DNA transposition AAA+ family ATPase